MPDISNREALEDAKRELAEIEARIKEHEHEIARLNTEKAKIMKTMSLLMDSSTEERLLAEVYEQRKKMRS
jgi:predicted  nucleic acid-binding Zn-ribbon protein